MVGSDFAAYARLFHPLDDRPGGPTWSQVARANGRIMHASADWQQVNPTARSGRSSGEPMGGELEGWALEALCDVLARHTSTADQCYFAVWEGCGGLHEPSAVMYAVRAGADPMPAPPGPAPQEWQLDLSGPRFPMPARDEFYLFEGEVHAATRIGYWLNENSFRGISPHFMWPADHAWCVATEVDFDSTIIGGPQALVDELCASELLEVLQLDPGAPVLDLLNPQAD